MRRALAAAPPSPRAAAPSDEKRPPRPRSPPPLAALLAPLLLVRLAAALLSPIADCDETFNYWEPMHFLLYGEGLQTWEYSPAYALRSYAYLALHAAAARLAAPLVVRRAQFFAVRAALGALSALLEARFARRVCVWASTEVGEYTWLLLLSSAGMFHAAVAFLPSSFAMLAVLVAWTAWMDAAAPRASASLKARAYATAIFAIAGGCLIGWPFLCIAAVPLALDAIISLGPIKFAAISMRAAAVFVLPSAAFDSYMYGKPVLAWLNILLYNRSAASGAGSQLYGVEPWYFYLINLTLNFNLALPAFLLAPLVLLATRGAAAASPWRREARSAAFLSGGFVWLGFYSAVPHKEERFMSVCYPLLCLAAAVAVSEARAWLSSRLPPAAPRAAAAWPRLWLLPALALSGSACLSAARIGALVRYYAAPLQVYSELHDALSGGAYANQRLVVCTGKEWYRFPSSFFLPPTARLAFIRDGFDGLLPSHFTSPAPQGSRIVHSHFNDQNADEPSAYEKESNCDFIVDLELASDRTHRSATPAWHVWTQHRFLDASRSPSWSRALYIPMISDQYNTYADYVVLGRKPRPSWG
ncbi:hypothetical protein AB1Y20_002985 [Prymnesium parvum]|uniref:Mannosyltransferase n=1 Tax=Prymnesium parvum TaxID=97485 RepID=A0AB34JCB2_PRYPA